MSTAKVLITEGTSELAWLKAADRRVSELAATRHRFSQLHELGHHILADPGANESGKSGAFDCLLILTRPEHDHVADLPTAFSALALQSGTKFLTLSAERPPASGLPTWNTRMFVGLTGVTWLGDDLRTARPDLASSGHTAPRPTAVQVVVRLRAANGSLQDSWAAMIRAIDRALTTVLLMRLLVRTSIRRRPHAGFVLVIIAACRRYGRRSEPDDHASPLVRRHQMSTGNCLLV